MAVPVDRTCHERGRAVIVAPAGGDHRVIKSLVATARWNRKHFVSGWHHQPDKTFLYPVLGREEQDMEGYVRLQWNILQDGVIIMKKCVCLES